MNRFLQAIENFWANTGIPNRFNSFVRNSVEWFEDELAELIDLMIGELNLPQPPPGYSEIRQRMISGDRKPAMVVILLSTLGGMVLGALQGAMRPISLLVQYEVNKLIRPNRFNPAEVNELINRGIVPIEEIRDDLDDLGYSDLQIQQILDARFRLLQTDEILALLNRGEINENEATTKMLQIGYEVEDAFKVIKLREVIPSVGDLISMAVREAFNDPVAERFGYDEGFPAEILEFTRKQGLTDDFARRFWRAHWQLPGVGQAFEMYQRLRQNESNGGFPLSALNQYLVAADIPAYYRDRLRQIAFNPLTRVDVRRMYSTGTLDRDGVYNAYLDVGFSPENAELMTDFTIKYETSAQKDLTRASIQGGYKRGVMSRNEALQALQSIGYDTNESEFWLDVIDVDLAQEQNDEIIDHLEFLFINNQISDTDLVSRLASIGLPNQQIERLLERLEIRREANIKIPSRTDLETFYKLEIIDIDQYVRGMVALGYRETDVSLYQELLDIEIAEEKAKELERTQKEQERTRQANLSNQYQINKADLDVQIAEAKLAIADIKVALHSIEDTDDIEELKLRIDELKAFIAVRNVDKAELRVSFEESL